jgi:putative ABC transport system permease protein
MFDLDKWQEILETIRKNKLRTFLTAFSVAWGILFLVLFSGFANGLQNGVMEEFQGDAINSIWVRAGKTSIPYKGMQRTRWIAFTNEDYELLKTNIQGVEHVSGRNDVWTVKSISYKNESSLFGIVACHSGYRYLEKLELTDGRFINDDDVREGRKVAVLGVMVAAQFFQGANPVGETIFIDKIPFLVVGTFQDKGGERDQRRLYIPMSTGQKIFNQINRIHRFAMITPGVDLARAKEMKEQIRNLLAERHTVSPDDVSAIAIYDDMEDYLKYKGLFNVVGWIVWLVGVVTIVSGVVGVGNIMTISVRERTKEIGIRKVLGATPFSIVNLIMQEAVLITVIAGYFGLVAGIGLLELLNYGMVELKIELDFFRNPGVDFMIALYATIILVVAGLIAGLIPAMKAAAISPIAAIREE